MSITEPFEAPAEPSAPVEGTPSEPVEAANSEPGETYTVKVGGEEVQVTRDELLNGYSRTQDYTRKTQELAEQRKRLAQYEALGDALDKDPVGTIKILEEAYKISPESAQGWDEMDPQEQKVARLERDLAQLQAREARTYIENEITSLEREYGDSFDRHEVMKYALQNDTDVTTAYKLMNFDG
ncbi:MAG: hypothetical protein ACREBC_38845, partial [Pyrinomonadaceae bacterium]